MHLLVCCCWLSQHSHSHRGVDVILFSWFSVFCLLNAEKNYIFPLWCHCPFNTPLIQAHRSIVSFLKRVCLWNDTVHIPSHAVRGVTCLWFEAQMGVDGDVKVGAIMNRSLSICWVFCFNTFTVSSLSCLHTWAAHPLTLHYRAAGERTDLCKECQLISHLCEHVFSHLQWGKQMDYLTW